MKRGLAVVFLMMCVCGKGVLALGGNVPDNSISQRASHHATQAACGDVNVATFEQASAALRRQVQSCVTSQTFAMGQSEVQLLMRNIPLRFDQFNARPRGCVQMEFTVERVVNGAVTRGWYVVVDADGPTTGPRPQRAHYGYTVQGTVPRIPRASGHIFFTGTDTPPYVRPWNAALGQRVSFTDQISTQSTRYTLRGTSYNQFYTLSSPLLTQAATNDDQDGAGSFSVTGQRGGHASAATVPPLRDFM